MREQATAIALVASLASIATPAQARDLFSLCTLAVAPTAPDALWTAWSFAPATLLPLGLVLALAMLGWARAACQETDTARRNCFLAGWCLLVLALMSPLCRMAATLVSAHMVQLMLLALAAPLLLALARPLQTLCTGLPERFHAWRSGLTSRNQTRAADRLTLLTLLYGVAIWLWHVPSLYTLILADSRVHVAAFALLIIVAIAFWHAVVNTREEGRAILMLFATMAHTGLLGAILTFSTTLLYPVQVPGALAWGIDPLRDQQLAGLIMWVPGSLFYLTVTLALFARWLRRSTPVPSGETRPPRVSGEPVAEMRDWSPAPEKSA